MPFLQEFYLDIASVFIAHKFVIDRAHRCDYTRGRGAFGLVYILDGNAEYRFQSGERIGVDKGDVIFFAPGAAYSIVTESPLEHYTVNFDIHESTSHLGELSAPYILLNEKSTEHIERAFKRLVGVWGTKKVGYEMLATAYLYELVSLFYSDICDGNRESNKRLLPAKEYIEQHFNRAFTLEELAFISDMSVTNFRREWKRQYSETPMQYRDAIRLGYAKEYLGSGYYTISEIAQKCGFDDVSYFVRFFKKRAGITPGQFKKQYLKG